MRERKAVARENRWSVVRALLVSGFAASLTVGAVQGGAVTGQAIANSTPKFVATAKNLGPEDPSKVIDVSVWLNLRDRGALDTLAEELYDPNSGHYHNWLKRADFAAKFAPTAAEAKTVEEFLSSHNLPVVTVGPENLFVRARGTVGAVQNAFHVQINNFSLNGKTYRANLGDPYVEGAAASLIQKVSGLDSLEVQHPMKMRPIQLPNQTSAPLLQSADASADPMFFKSHCFTGPKTEHYTTSGGFPTATYRGNGYYSPPTEPGCGYTPP